MRRSCARWISDLTFLSEAGGRSRIAPSLIGRYSEKKNSWDAETAVGGLGVALTKSMMVGRSSMYEDLSNKVAESVCFTVRIALSALFAHGDLGDIR